MVDRDGHALGGGVQLPAGRSRDPGRAAAGVGRPDRRLLERGARRGRRSRSAAAGRGVGDDGARLARLSRRARRRAPRSRSPTSCRRASPSSMPAPPADADGVLRVNGGRVLNVTAVAPTFAEAQRLSREAAEADRVRGQDLPARHRVARGAPGWRRAAGCRRSRRVDFRAHARASRSRNHRPRHPPRPRRPPLRPGLAEPRRRPARRDPPPAAPAAAAARRSGGLPPGQARRARARRAPAGRAAGHDRLAGGPRPAAHGRGGAVRGAPRAARRRPRAGLPRRPPHRARCCCSTPAVGRATPRRSAPSRSTPEFTAERLGARARALAAGGEEGDHGPAAPRRRGQHLRQRGAVRGRDRPVEAGAAAHARTTTAGCTPRSGASWPRRSPPTARPCGTTAPAPASRATSSSSSWSTAARASRAGAAAPGSPAPTRSTPASPSSATAASREPRPPGAARRPAPRRPTSTSSASGCARWPRTGRRSTG